MSGNEPFYPRATGSSWISFIARMKVDELITIALYI